MADIIFLSKEGLDRYDLDMKNFIDKKIEEVNKKGIINTTSSTLEGSYTGGLVINSIQGKTEQNAYIGKNLLDCNGLTEKTVNGVTFTPVYDDNGNLLYVNANGTATSQSMYSLLGHTENDAEKDLYVSGCLDGDGGTHSICISYYDENVSWKNESYQTYGSIAIDKKYPIYSVVILVRKDTTVNNVKFYPMISEEGGEYEPYVGGKPSPSPSYPQEIKSVKGKNLLDCRGLVATTNNGITYTPVYDEFGNLQYINANGTATAQASYYIGKVSAKAGEEFIANTSCGTETGIYNMYLSGGIHVYSGDTKFAVSEDKNVVAQIVVLSGVTANNVKFYPMIRRASVADPTYVPYGLLRIKTHGKNLFPFPNVYYNGTGSTFAKNTDGTYSLNGNVTGNEIRFLGSYANTDKVITLKNGNYKCVATINDKVINSDVTLTNGTTVKGYSGNNFAITDEWAISSLKVTVPSDVSSYSNAILKIMICDYNASDNFEPYQSSEITLSEPIELNGFNGVYDVVTSDGVTRRFAEKRILSSDIADIRITSNGNYVYTHELSDVKIYGSCLCTHFVGIGYDDRVLNTNSQRCYIDSETKIIYFRDNLENLVFTDLENAKTFFDENEVYLLYELATPTTEELQTKDIIALKSLKTFDEVTYVEVDCEGNPIIDMDYGCTKVGATALENHNNIEINSINDEEKIQDIEKNGFGIELTKAEYDALSEEEKNKGTYWITDDDDEVLAIELDKTLSIENTAADAKAVGDALSNPKNLLTNIYFSSANTVKIEYTSSNHTFDIVRGGMHTDGMGLTYIFLLKDSGLGEVLCQVWGGGGSFRVITVTHSYDSTTGIRTIVAVLDNNMQGSYGIKDFNLEKSYVHSAFL